MLKISSSQHQNIKTLMNTLISYFQILEECCISPISPDVSLTWEMQVLCDYQTLNKILWMHWGRMRFDKDVVFLAYRLKCHFKQKNFFYQNFVSSTKYTCLRCLSGGLFYISSTFHNENLHSLFYKT